MMSEKKQGKSPDGQPADKKAGRQRSRFAKAEIIAVIGEFRLEGDPPAEELHKIKEFRREAERILEQRASTVEQERQAKASSVLAKMRQAAGGGDVPQLKVVEEPAEPREEAKAETPTVPAVAAFKAEPLTESPSPAPKFESKLAPEDQPDKDQVVARAREKIGQEFGDSVQLVPPLLYLAMQSPEIAVNVGRVLIFYIKRLHRDLTAPDINVGYAGYLERLNNILQAHINAVGVVFQFYFGYEEDDHRIFPRNDALFAKIRSHIASDSELASTFTDCFEPDSESEFIAAEQEREAEQARTAVERERATAEAVERQRRAVERNLARMRREQETFELLVPVLDKTSAKPIAERIVKNHPDAPSANEGVIQAAVGKLLYAEQLDKEGKNGNQIQEVVELATQFAKAAGLSEQELDRRLAAHKSEEAGKSDAQRLAAERAKNAIPTDWRSLNAQQRAREAEHAAKNGGGKKKGKPTGEKGKKKPR